MTAVNKIILKIISLVLLAACLTVLFVSMALAKRDQVIYPSNVAVGGISIANLNHEEARARLQANMGNKWKNTLQLKIDKNNAVYAIPLSELKIYYNLDSSLNKTNQRINQPSSIGAALYHSIIRGAAVNVVPILDVKDKNLLYKKIAEIKLNLDKPATNARVLYNNGYMEYVEHKNGFSVDLDASFKLVEKALGKGSLGPITLVTKDLYPQVKIDDIKNITDLIGVSVISLEPGQREDELSTKLIANLNGFIVMPGDQFSLQTAVDRQLSKAEKSQPSFQLIRRKLSEVLMSACRATNLNITCYEPGELIFANNLGKPIMLSLSIEGNDLAVKIFGCQTEAGKEISLIKEQTAISPEIEIQVDNKLKPGARNVIVGHEGKIVRTYRLVKINGKQTEKKLLAEEVFPASNTITKVTPDVSIK